MLSRILVCVFLSSLFTGCGEEEKSICEELPNLDICVGAKACVPGEVKECPCADGNQGVQSCNEEGTGLSVCSCGEEFVAVVGDASTATEPDVVDGEPVCESHSYTDCNGNALHWFNSCLEQEELIEVCPEGQCKLNATSCCDGQVPQCYQGSIYWFNACEELGEMKEACPEGTTCQQGSEAGDLPSCEAAQCEYNAYTECHNPIPTQPSTAGNVYNFDSCEVPTNVAKVCECQEICWNAGCVKSFWDGNWVVTLTGSCALGQAINYTGVTFEVSGESVTVQANVGGDVVTYTGTMDCSKTFVVTGSLTTIIGTATETWSCQFDSLTHFTGQVAEESPLGSCLYDLEGYRQ